MEVWRKISQHVSLVGSELSEFVAHCELAFGQAEPPGGGPDSLDWKHYLEQFDRLHKAIATWLTNNPNGDFIERDYLLAAIGRHLSRSGLIQRFPEPDIPYEKNQAAADRLKALVDGIPGGYLAIVGPAGVGKSTLVQDVLTDSAYPLLVPYYAFLPSTDGNRDRAEALTFFQDVVARLDRFDCARHSLGVADIAQGRDALRCLMSSANRRYIRDGQKTILLIDGLDHVLREVNLQTPVLNELPDPSDIPEGFLIILSGQPQAFLSGAISGTLAATVAGDGKRLEVFGLSRTEVDTLVSRLSNTTTGTERDLLYDASPWKPPDTDLPPVAVRTNGWHKCDKGDRTRRQLRGPHRPVLSGAAVTTSSRRPDENTSRAFGVGQRRRSRRHGLRSGPRRTRSRTFIDEC